MEINGVTCTIQTYTQVLGNTRTITQEEGKQYQNINEGYLESKSSKRIKNK